MPSPQNQKLPDDVIGHIGKFLPRSHQIFSVSKAVKSRARKFNIDLTEQQKTCVRFWHDEIIEHMFVHGGDYGFRCGRHLLWFNLIDDTEKYGDKDIFSFHCETYPFADVFEKVWKHKNNPKNYEFVLRVHGFRDDKQLDFPVTNLIDMSIIFTALMAVVKHVMIADNNSILRRDNVTRTENVPTFFESHLQKTYTEFAEGPHRIVDLSNVSGEVPPDPNVEIARYDHEAVVAQRRQIATGHHGSPLIPFKNARALLERGKLGEVIGNRRKESLAARAEHDEAHPRGPGAPADGGASMSALASLLPQDVAQSIGTMKLERMQENFKRLNDATLGVTPTRASMQSKYVIHGYQLQCTDTGTIELLYDAPERRTSRSSGHTNSSGSGRPGHDIMTVVKWVWTDVGDKKTAVVKIGMLENYADDNAVHKFISALNDKKLIRILLSIVYKYAIYKHISPEDIKIDISIPKKRLDSIKTVLSKYFSK